MCIFTYSRIRLSVITIPKTFDVESYIDEVSVRLFSRHPLILIVDSLLIEVALQTASIYLLICTKNYFVLIIGEDFDIYEQKGKLWTTGVKTSITFTFKTRDSMVNK